MAAKWLLKSDPECYSFGDLRRDKKTVWDGISNNLALKYLRTARAGDLALIYHSGSEKCLAGLAEIVSDPYIDPKQDDPRLMVVDIEARGELPRRVSLAEVKERAAFQNFALVRLPRLSFMPVSDAQWKALMKLAGAPA